MTGILAAYKNILVVINRIHPMQSLSHICSSGVFGPDMEGVLSQGGPFIV